MTIVSRLGAARSSIQFSKVDLAALDGLPDVCALYQRAKDAALLEQLNRVGHVYDPERKVLYRIPPEPILTVPSTFTHD